jgi:hypothetical protein
MEGRLIKLQKAKMVPLESRSTWMGWLTIGELTYWRWIAKKWKRGVQVVLVNKNRMKMKSIALIVSAVLVCHLSAHGANDIDRQFDDFYKTFVDGNSQVRQAMVIGALDDNLIVLGMDKTRIQRLFREKLTFYIEKQEYSKAVVLFRPAEAGPSPLANPYITGWYVCFRFDENGKLEDYFISSRHPFWGKIM